MSEAVWRWTLEEAAGALRAGSLDVVELTEIMLARVEALDPELRAYETVAPESARSEARRLADELLRGVDRGPLHGIPIAIKDLCDTAGLRTAAGTRVLDDRIPTEDATVVARLRAAGAVVLGKLKMTEGAYAAHHPEVAPPVNPHLKDRWTGVSSSGSGVATAAGLCFASLGTDTGGSIRFPSSANGIVGAKPTWGRVSRAGVFPLADSLDHVGPMTRSVRDAAVVLAAIAGRDPRDPTTLAGPVPDFLAAIEEGAAGFRLGIDRAWMAPGMDGDIVARVEAAASGLARAGADLREVAVPATAELSVGWGLACAVEAALGHEGLYPERRAEYGPDLAALLDAGRALDALSQARLAGRRAEFSGNLAALFEDIDVLVCPALGIALPGASGPELGDDLGALERLMRFTAPFDFSGNPTVTVPCGRMGDGAPLGLQLVGRHREEALLLRVARTWEKAAGNHGATWPEGAP